MTLASSAVERALSHGASLVAAHVANGLVAELLAAQLAAADHTAQCLELWRRAAHAHGVALEMAAVNALRATTLATNDADVVARLVACGGGGASDIGLSNASLNELLLGARLGRAAALLALHRHDVDASSAMRARFIGAALVAAHQALDDIDAKLRPHSAIAARHLLGLTQLAAGAPRDVEND